MKVVFDFRDPFGQSLSTFLYDTQFNLEDQNFRALLDDKKEGNVILKWPTNGKVDDSRSPWYIRVTLIED